MRVSLVARYASHPVIDFGTAHGRARRARLGLERSRTTYHRPRGARPLVPTIRVLRSQTSRFRFPSVAGLARVHVRRAVPPFGVSRARRA